MGFMGFMGFIGFIGFRVGASKIRGNPDLDPKILEALFAGTPKQGNPALGRP